MDENVTADSGQIQESFKTVLRTFKEHTFEEFCGKDINGSGHLFLHKRYEFSSLKAKHESMVSFMNTKIPTKLFLFAEESDFFMYPNIKVIKSEDCTTEKSAEKFSESLSEYLFIEKPRVHIHYDLNEEYNYKKCSEKIKRPHISHDCPYLTYCAKGDFDISLYLRGNKHENMTNLFYFIIQGKVWNKSYINEIEKMIPDIAYHMHLNGFEYLGSNRSGLDIAFVFKNEGLINLYRSYLRIENSNRRARNYQSYDEFYKKYDLSKIKIEYIEETP